MSILIRVKNNDVGAAIRILKRKMADENVLKDLKAHEYYLTKSQKRRLKHKEALKRINKAKRIQEEIEIHGSNFSKMKKKNKSDSKKSF